MISIIVAISEENAIGKQGGLLCHLPNDLKHFKAVTSGATVIMGERTFFSLPKHPLPNRRNIVITDVAGKTFDGAESAYSIEEAVNKASLIAQKNDIVLFSPACKDGDMDYSNRGDTFVREVHKLNTGK